ncbi:MAG TPA: nucleotidyltransferase family protein [Candidatus Tripitaka californicus]|uniref:nucleotidyltransferase family protein n=1 Tax=Candidatus Tripitaka californicus TaxID=3367616 RepID=UPI0040250F0E|nr:nucleotidyltransferase domain-containing protein [Planctomycetota bacterium]
MELCKGLREALGENILSIRFYGSKARGDFTEESDIDMLVVLKKEDIKLSDRIYEIALEVDLKYDARISLIIYPEKEFKWYKNLGSIFIEKVEEEGVIL